jgi:T5SS/PEP-CTERM-associated repeat protein
MKLKNLAVMLLCSTALPAFSADIEIDGGTSVSNNNTSVSADNLKVGIDYSGNSLIITNNATVTVDNAYIGSDSSDENSLFITGSNSYLQASSTLNVVEKGTLDVTNGGWVYVGSMDTNAPASGGIRVGDTNGTASLSVESGTQITAENLLVGVQSDETGSVTLSGAETTFTLSNNLQLGTAGSNNTVTVGGGATLSIGDALQVGSTNGGNNHLYINDGGSVAILGATTITDGTTNSINVASGGTLSLSEGMDLDETSNGFNFKSVSALQLGGTLFAE